MSPKHSERLAKLITPAFLDVLGDIDGQLDTAAAATSNMYKLRNQVNRSIREIDWTSSGLVGNLPYDFSAEAWPHPREFAERIGNIAFEDSVTIIKLCRDIEQGEEPLDEVAFAQKLLRSKQPLLVMSKLPDPQERGFIRAISNPGQVSTADNIDFSGEDLIVTGLDSNNRSRFEWSPVVLGWVNSNTKEDSGCPARHIIIEDEDGDKHILIYYFWEKIIEAAYPTIADLAEVFAK